MRSIVYDVIVHNPVAKNTSVLKHRVMNKQYSERRKKELEESVVDLGGSVEVVEHEVPLSLPDIHIGRWYRKATPAKDRQVTGITGYSIQYTTAAGKVGERSLESFLLWAVEDVTQEHLRGS